MKPPTRPRPARWPGERRDRGASGIQFAALAAPLLLLLLVGVGVYRAAQANLAVGAAAYDAARAASISRTAGQAQSTARQAAAASLTQLGLACTNPQVTLDLTGFTQPVGQPATVTATVTCTADTSELGIGPGRTYTATAMSSLDTYRERS